MLSGWQDVCLRGDSCFGYSGHTRRHFPAAESTATLATAEPPALASIVTTSQPATIATPVGTTCKHCTPAVYNH